MVNSASRWLLAAFLILVSAPVLALDNEECLACHEDPDLTGERNGEEISVFVDPEAFAASIHGDLACDDCHMDLAGLEDLHEDDVEAVDCSFCHSEPADEYEDGIHGVLHAQGDPDAPACVDCHGKHDILPSSNPASRTFKLNTHVLCATCHRAGEKAAVRIESKVSDISASYIDSIHGRGLLRSGLLVSASCADCHTPHGELPPTDARSTVHPSNVAKTCGKCHFGIEEVFETSVHGALFESRTESENEAGEHRLPSCADCHSSHSISRTDETAFRFQVMDQCGNCHEEESETFFDTFHGKVTRLGSAGAAKCYDCHGTHNILPVSDPNSTLGKDHIVETCSQCHSGAHPGFAEYLTHATHHDRKKYPWLFWAFWGMTALLVGTLTVALLHTLAWLTRLWLSRDEWKQHKAARAKADQTPLFRRFDRFSRTLHLLMVLSFFTLALSGMALKFSHMGWTQGIAFALGGFDTMRILHRLAAVLLFCIFAAHLWDVLRKKRRLGKTWWQLITGPESILFNKRDLTEVTQTVRWFFGFGPRPRYGRYTYWEKFDYFAVLWGVVIIGSTGLILWFPEIFTRLLPGWSVNVATIIHSDEALLAVGFIFTIHFFNTH
ncbi:MAG: hypothetical protein KDD47_01600, partial [Acidobacteria bacterium]|nr:hypothetical protein [Acidobacteriota bacterium]